MRPAPRRPLLRAGALSCSAAVLWLAACAMAPGARRAGQDSGGQSAEVGQEAPVYAGRLAPGWQDWSWARRELRSQEVLWEGGPTIRMTPAANKGVYLHHDSFETHGFTDLVFRIHGGAAGRQKLFVCLADAQRAFGPRVPVDEVVEGGAIKAGEWRMVRVPLARLRGRNRTITGVVFQGGPGRARGDLHLADIRFTGRTLPAPKSATVTIDTTRGSRPISPLIYGMASAGRDYIRQLRLGVNRWGGNPNTRYNWEKGNCWNHGRDWEFRNTRYGARKPEDAQPSAVADRFVRSTLEAGAAVLLTIPTIGWVAKDGRESTRSVGVPPKGGVPVAPGSEAIAGYDPTANRRRTSVASFPRKGRPFAFPPDLTDDAVYQDEWVHHLVQAFGTAARGGVRFYAMDNEPDLWAQTHTDVHPVAPGYDEMLSRFLDYAMAVKAVDPSAEVTGPVSWGWTGYLHSPQDAIRADWNGRPDRRAHGDLEFIPWFLQEVRRHDQRRGARTLDVLDVHFYPQAGRVFSGSSDPVVNARRLRSTRALWDPGYKDESWIGEPVRLIPRMREWIDRHYPGTKLGITEWNWGADKTLNGGLAIGECLGIFGREGVHMACYWTKPPKGSPGWHAFKLFRNADGSGAGLGDFSVPAQSSRPGAVSCFGGADGPDAMPNAILINKQPAGTAEVTVQVRHGRPVKRAQIWQFGGADAGGIRRLPDAEVKDGQLVLQLPGYSMTLLRFQ